MCSEVLLWPISPWPWKKQNTVLLISKWTKRQLYTWGLGRYNFIFWNALFILCDFYIEIYPCDEETFIKLQASFSEESLRENIGTFVNALLVAKPVGLKKSKWFTFRFERGFYCQEPFNTFCFILLQLRNMLGMWIPST